MRTTRAAKRRKAGLFIEAVNLSRKQREKLALILLDSLDDQEVSEAEAAKAWEKEILRRLEEVRSGTAKTIPAEEFFRDIRAQLKRAPRSPRAPNTGLIIEALNLRQKDREKLAVMLLDSLDDQEVSEAEAAKAWDKELVRRAEELRTGKVKGIPVEQVRRDVDTLLRRIRRKRK